MYNFIENQKSKLKKLYLVHGEYESQKAFKSFLHERGFTDIDIPAEGTIHKLN